VLRYYILISFNRLLEVTLLPMPDQRLMKELQTIINKILFLERKNLLRLKDITLYPSEIHLLLVVNRDQPSNATKMAEKLGITKGAVSQTLTRLERKRILIKSKDPYNKNELTVSLTATGKIAYDQYEKIRLSLFNQFESCFINFSASEREIIYRFLLSLESVLDQIE
jgi:DNA-binding MarR family transcriptional regulator